MVDRPFEDKGAAERVRQAKQLEKNVDADIDEFIAAALTTRQGRRFFWWLLQIGKVGLQPFSGNALTTAFQCGELNVGQQIQARIIEVDPEGFITLQKEKQEDARRAEQSHTSDAGDAEPA